MIAILIIYIVLKGYRVTFGDAWAKKDEGRPHSANSRHYDRLAIDLNLFKDGKYLSETEDHEPFGKFWQFMGGSWGGAFKDSKGNPRPDGNHYEWIEK